MIRQKAYDFHPPYLRLQSHLVTWGKLKVCKVSIYIKKNIWKLDKNVWFSEDAWFSIGQSATKCVKRQAYKSWVFKYPLNLFWLFVNNFESVYTQPSMYYTVEIWILDWSGIWMVESCPIAQWSVMWMPFEYWNKFCPVFRLPFENQTGFQMVVWIPKYHLNTGQMNTGQVKVCYSDVCYSDP